MFVLLLPVYEFSELVVVSSEVNLLFCVVLTVIILPVVVSSEVNLLFCVVFVVLFELV
jgi:hypothetical protein